MLDESHVHEPDAQEDHLSNRLEAAEKDAQWVEREIDSGFPILHSHSVVAIWGALEVLVEDLLITWLENYEDAWNNEAVRKLRIPVSDYHLSDERERLRMIVSELARKVNSRAQSGASNLAATLSIFGLSPRIGDNLRRALHELWQIRNVIVHCGGIADKRLVREYPYLGVQVGQRIHIYHSIYAWYMLAADRYLERLLDQAAVSLGFPGCHCPGMDNIPDRPPEEDLPT